MPASVKSSLCNIQIAAIGALTNIRKSSGTAGLLGRDSFSILHDCNGLKVIITVKRAVYSPVMRHGNLLPAFCSFDVMSLTELPLLKNGFCADALCKGRHSCQQNRQYQW